MAEFQNKLFQQYALTEYKNVFLFFIFVMAFFLSLYFVYKIVEISKITILDCLIDGEKKKLIARIKQGAYYIHRW